MSGVAVVIQEKIMESLLTSENLFYGGIAAMAAAVLMTVLCIVVFCITGKRIKKKLIREYGEPYRK